MTSHSIATANIYKSRKILLDQLETRGLDVSEYRDFTMDEIHILYEKDQLNMYIDNSVFVKYHLTKVPNETVIYDDIETLYTLEKKLNTQGQLIYIIKGDPNDGLLEVVRQVFIQQGIFITIYNMERLLFNILNHSLVPKHTILSDEDKLKVMAKYNMKNEREFPEISRFDPVAVAIGLRPNQLVHILRPSKTAIYTDYYRFCVQ
jgi:DNA-directed RNA polymerase subunit H (RpoH/RPB5)